jgi:hypothetical protein
VCLLVFVGVGGVGTVCIGGMGGFVYMCMGVVGVAVRHCCCVLDCTYICRLVCCSDAGRVAVHRTSSIAGTERFPLPSLPDPLTVGQAHYLTRCAPSGGPDRQPPPKKLGLPIHQPLTYPPHKAHEVRSANALIMCPACGLFSHLAYRLLR